MNGSVEHRRLIILGSGPAGCTAALYAARANLEPLLITGTEQGGQLMTTQAVDNWPADVDGVLGPELMDRFIRHAERFGSQIHYDEITSVDLSTRPLQLVGEIASFTCDALIIATGSTAKSLGLPSEELFFNRGVSACATCDGYHYKGQPVAIVGGGNTAVEEALLMASLCPQVHLVHRRDSLRAEPILVSQLERKVADGIVKIHWDSEVDVICGDDAVSCVRLRNNVSGEHSQIDVSGVFIAIGHTPQTDLFASQLKMEEGYITTGETNTGATATSVAGVFAAGDVQDPVYRQAVTSAGSGCMAAMDARHYLESLASLQPT